MDRNLLSNLSFLIVGIFLLANSCTTILFAQPRGTAELPNEDALESLLEEHEQETIDEGILELLTGYRTTPLLLSTATVEELTSLPGVSPQNAQRILAFVKTEKPETFDQLAEVEDISQDVIDILRLYTQLSPSPERQTSTRKLHMQFRSRAHTDLQTRQGYRDTLFRQLVHIDSVTGNIARTDTVAVGPRYVGNGVGVLSRFLVSYREFSGGITFEKDPGEQLFYNDTLSFSYENYEAVQPGTALQTRRGFGSFLSVHAQADLKPATIVLGDYRIEFGQGLLFGNQFAGRKGGMPTRDPYQAGQGVQPYRSSGEAAYFRGVGVTLQRGEWLPAWLESSVVFSSRRRDATIDQHVGTDGDTNHVVRTIRADGLLQTRGDIRRDDQLHERLAGLNVKGIFSKGSLEVSGYSASYSVPVQITSNGQTEGTHYGASLSGEMALTKGRTFGEVAISANNGFAGILGLAVDLSGTDLTVSGRYYAPSFYSPHGTGFGESPANPRNELGLYVGLRSRLYPRTFLSLYGDLYHFPHGSSSVPFPVTGIDGMGLLEYGITPDLKLSLRLRAEERDDAVSTEDELGRNKTLLIDRGIASARLNATWKPRNGPVEARFRIERKWAAYSHLLPSTTGSLAWMDLRWKGLPELSFGTRLVLFNAPTADVRLYEFEQDLPGRVSIPALSGEGGRFYGLLRWTPLPSLGLSLRYSETWYSDRKVIAPGSLREITGNTTGQIAVQIDWEK